MQLNSCSFKELDFFDLWIADSGFQIPESRFWIPCFRLASSGNSKISCFPTGAGGASLIKRTGMLVRNFENNPHEGPRSCFVSLA